MTTTASQMTTAAPLTFRVRVRHGVRRTAQLAPARPLRGGRGQRVRRQPRDVRRVRARDRDRLPDLVGDRVRGLGRSTTSGSTATGRSAHATSTRCSRPLRFFAVSLVAFGFTYVILITLVGRRDAEGRRAGDRDRGRARRCRSSGRSSGASGPSPRASHAIALAVIAVGRAGVRARGVRLPAPPERRPPRSTDRHRRRARRSIRTRRCWSRGPTRHRPATG